MKVLLTRHGETYGNKLKRYVGTTYEDLIEKSIFELKKSEKIKVDILFVSPLKRCLETAEILYEAKEVEVVDDLKECDFGDFENKNYLELADNVDYQKWIDSNGTLAFPNGEGVEQFKNRVVNSFNQCILTAEGAKTVGFVFHNGCVMAIMSRLFGGDYYSYSIKNGETKELIMENFKWSK